MCLGATKVLAQIQFLEWTPYQVRCVSERIRNSLEVVRETSPGMRRVCKMADDHSHDGPTSSIA